MICFEWRRGRTVFATGGVIPDAKNESQGLQRFRSLPYTEARETSELDDNELVFWEWTAEHHHQPSDQYSEDWALGGALQDMKLWLHMGVDLGYSSEFPNWYEGTEFEALRVAMFRGGE